MGDWLVSSAFGRQECYTPYFPITNVHTKLPPHFLINAEWDLSLIKHTWDYAFTLRAHGIYVVTKLYSGNHFSIIRNWDSTNRHVWKAVRSFVIQCVAMTYDYHIDDGSFDPTSDTDDPENLGDDEEQQEKDLSEIVVVG